MSRFTIKRDNQENWIGELLSSLSLGVEDFIESMGLNFNDLDFELTHKIADGEVYITCSFGESAPENLMQFVIIHVLDPAISRYDDFAYFEQEDNYLATCHVGIVPNNSTPKFIERSNIIKLTESIMVDELSSTVSDIFDVTDVVVDNKTGSDFGIYIEFTGHIYQTSCYIEIDTDIVNSEDLLITELIDQGISQALENLQTR